MFKTIHECRLELAAHSVGPPLLDGPPYLIDLDLFPCSAARVSFGNEDKTGQDIEADTKLMKYLAKHDHLSPFEHQSASFLIEVPLFIRSQIMRHRVFAYNETSRRYTDENIEFWIPDKWRKQSKSNKQASTDEELDVDNFTVSLGWTKDENGVPRRDGSVENGHNAFTEYKYGVVYPALHLYEDFLDNGVCREQARALLPQSLLTKFYMSGSLRNWVAFLKLRLDDHSQYEVRVVAERIKNHLLNLWPTATGVLLNND